MQSKWFPDKIFNYDNVKYDTDQKASGSGALEFIIPTRSGEDTTAWRTDFTEDNSVKFGAGQDVYAQWRQRFDANMLNSVYDTDNLTYGGWKQFFLDEGDIIPNIVRGDGSSVGEIGSCRTMELVVNNGEQRHFPRM